jgi:ABC-type nickel/cobalt efflux system permease component RcnA
MLRTLAAAAHTGFELSLVASSFLFGFRHGIDWDHIAAITDITSSQEDRRDSILFGTLYALGHALVVFVIGSFAIVLGENLPEGVDQVMERVVGVTLVILGIYVFVALVRHGREFRMRSRWMLIFAGVRGMYRRLRPSAVPEHEPVHVHAGEGSTAVATAEDIPVSEWHHGHHGRPGHHHHTHPEPDAFMNYGKRTAFLVGMIHGVGAETPTQLIIFLTVAGAGGHLAGEILLATFLIGLLSSNTLITMGTAFGFVRASKNWTLYVTVAVLTATFSLVIGTLFVFGRGTVLPALFGG